LTIEIAPGGRGVWANTKIGNTKVHEETKIHQNAKIHEGMEIREKKRSHGGRNGGTKVASWVFAPSWIFVIPIGR
jgi:hypothetical protein